MQPVSDLAGLGLRSVLFDTETPGLHPLNGDRVIEIAALELINDLPTGRHFHALIDPQRDVPPESPRSHGFTPADLAVKPVFADIAAELLAFLDNGRMIAPNAPFDFGFLDMEFGRAGYAPLARDRMVDTLALAKTRFPGMPNSLDALCRRFSIDLSARTSHNALLDCRLLAEVYVELTGGRQRRLSLAAETAAPPLVVYAHPSALIPRPVVPSVAELAAHAAFIAGLKHPLWSQP